MSDLRRFLIINLMPRRKFPGSLNFSFDVCCASSSSSFKFRDELKNIAKDKTLIASTEMFLKEIMFVIFISTEKLSRLFRTTAATDDKRLKAITLLFSMSISS
jgi:hypothetical protein